MTTKNEDFSGTLGEYTQLRATAASISGGRLVGSTAASTGIFHSSGTYGNDQSSSILVQDTGANYYYSALVRVVFTGTGDFTCYQGTLGVSSGDAYISEVTAGSGSDLTTGSLGRALTTADRIELDVSGTTLTLKVNGSTVISTSDATYASGKPGIEMFGIGQVDDAVFSDGGGGGSPTTDDPLLHMREMYEAAKRGIRAIGSGWKRNSDGRLLVPAYPMG